MVNFGCEMKMNFALMCFTLMIFKTKGQEYNITGSSTLAVLGEEFTWTCSMFTPPKQTVNAVRFYRGNLVCAAIGLVTGKCTVQILNDRYTYGCLSNSIYTLTIPAQNMAEYEQRSTWSCKYVSNSSYRSPDAILKIAIEVHNISLSPNNGQLTLRENLKTEVMCEINDNAVPSPTITWFLGTTYISSTEGTYTTSINITGKREDNTKTLQCKATNNYKPPKTAVATLNVEYPPTVRTFWQQNIIEGRNLTVTCDVIPGNPNTTILFWTQEGNPLFRRKGATLLLPKIQRSSSGEYKCIAENIYSNGEKGRNNQSMILNVLYPPSLEDIPLEIVNESSTVSLNRKIFSNPLSNVSWYRGTKLLKTETSVKTATYIIERTMCTDTHNLTLQVNNVVGNVSVLVELIVNCMPKPETTHITLGVPDSTGIDFSVTVLAYPSPQYKLQREDGAIDNIMQNSIYMNAVNNFTLRFNKNIVDQSDFGIYHLIVSNPFGVATIFILVLPQRIPNIPRDVTLTCEVTSASVHWVSSFNGGDTQTFTVVAFNVKYGTRYSERIPDMGENTAHSNFIHNLQPSTSYSFHVSAENSHGNSSSENIICTTQNKDTGSLQTAVIAGGVGGTLTVVVIVLITVFFVYRRYICKSVLQKRNKEKAATMKEDAAYYTTIAEQENREKNVYESLQRQNANSREWNDSDKSHREFNTKDSTTQVSDCEHSTRKPANVYVNTSFM